MLPNLLKLSVPWFHCLQNRVKDATSESIRSLTTFYLAHLLKCQKTTSSSSSYPFLRRFFSAVSPPILYTSCHSTKVIKANTNSQSPFHGTGLTYPSHLSPVVLGTPASPYPLPPWWSPLALLSSAASSASPVIRKSMSSIFWASACSLHTPPRRSLGFMHPTSSGSTTDPMVSLSWTPRHLMSMNVSK